MKAARSTPSFAERPAVRIAFGAVVATLALFALHALASEITGAQLRAALAATPASDILLAVTFTAFSFCALALYDVIAVRVVAPGRVPATLAAATGAAGYAISNMLGFALLTGGAVRARIYGARGLEPGVVAGVLATTWITFWMGVAVAIGLVLLPGTGPAARLGLPPLADRVIGTLLLTAVAGAFLWLATGERTLRLRGTVLRLPSARLAAAQTATALLDVGGAAMALWVLLPASVEVGPATFFVAYMAAIVVGIVSHSPGGLGAFEATLMTVLGLFGRADVLAALILYRLVYYVLPFTITAIVLATTWWRANRENTRGRLGAAGRVANAIGAPLVPPLAAGTAMLAGAVLLVSGALPVIGTRREALEVLLPLSLVETSHLFGSALGAGLIVLAHGLLHRRRRAWVLAIAALGLAMVASLLKGLDWEEASLMLLAMALLGTFRRTFHRDGASARPTLSWLAGGAVIVGASTWLALIAHRGSDLADLPFWSIAWSADEPRALRASALAAAVLLIAGIATLLRRPAPRDRADPIPAAVHRLVALSADTEAAIALLGDKRFLVAPNEDAFLMFRETRTAVIAKGDPVIASETDRAAGEALVWQLLERADARGALPAFYAVGTANLPLYLEMGLSVIKIGEVARVDLQAFSMEGKHRKELRYARSKAERDGLEFKILPVEEVPAVMDELRAVSDAWLGGKAGAEKSFALGGFDPTYLSNFPVAVMRRRRHAEEGQSPTGEIVAFANLWPGDGRAELSLDLMRHSPDAPSVTMNALFAELMLWGKEQGYRWFNMGAAPFAGMSDHPLAARWSRLGAFVYEHGEAFYHFEGLRAFKEKFDPVWSPNYLACPGGTAPLRVLLEVNRLVSGGTGGLLKRED